VPNYVRNLFNTRVIAYSGELDRQIQAARVMEEAYKSEGRELTHLIGPGVEHKYESQTLEDLMARLEQAASQAKQRPAKHVHLQTRTLRYPQVDWVTVLRLEEHWKDCRVDAEIVDEKSYRLTTKNVAALRIGRDVNTDLAVVNIDGVTVGVGSKTGALLVKRNGTWEFLPAYDLDRTQLAKGPELTGPIDDAFMSRFLIVVPTGRSKNARFQQWTDFESAHFISRWKALMRGEPRLKRDVDVTDGDLLADQNLILWGDPDSNSAMARLLQDTPISFADQKWKLGDREVNGDQFVPVAIYPRKNAKGEYRRYLVLNSGLTFREGHDRTNSLQNPKLPDWAIIDITQPPDAFAPGRIHDAGFFDEQWQLKAPPKAP
jgi:hypothetical protein